LNENWTFAKMTPRFDSLFCGCIWPVSHDCTEATISQDGQMSIHYHYLENVETFLYLLRLEGQSSYVSTHRKRLHRVCENSRSNEIDIPHNT
jgi:hypothetical protein